MRVAASHRSHSTPASATCPTSTAPSGGATASHRRKCARTLLASRFVSPGAVAARRNRLSAFAARPRVAKRYRSIERGSCLFRLPPIRHEVPVPLELEPLLDLAFLQ